MKDSRYSYVVPPAPVCTLAWTERDWLRYARRYGRVERRGPTPTVMYCGKAVPLARDVAGNIQFNDKGEPLYDVRRAFVPPVGGGK